MKKLLIPILAALFIVGGLKIVDARLFNPTTSLSGDQTISGDLTVTGDITVSGSTTSTYAGGVAVDTSDFVVIPGTSRVGIGTAAPETALHIGNGADASPYGTAGQYVYFTFNGQTDFFLRDSTNDVQGRYTVYSGGVLFGAATNHPLELATNNTTQMSINTSGHLVPATNNTRDLGAFGTAWRNIFASGTIYASSIIGPTTTSTITLSSSYTLATGTRSNLVDFVMPYSCTVGEVVMNATSTVAGQPTVIDVNRMTSAGVGTTTLFTTQGERPQLNAGGFTSSTVPDVTALTKGQVLNFDIDQLGGHGGINVQILCARPL